MDNLGWEMDEVDGFFRESIVCSQQKTIFFK